MSRKQSAWLMQLDRHCYATQHPPEFSTKNICRALQPILTTSINSQTKNISKGLTISFSMPKEQKKKKQTCKNRCSNRLVFCIAIPSVWLNVNERIRWLNLAAPVTLHPDDHLHLLAEHRAEARGPMPPPPPSEARFLSSIELGCLVPRIAGSPQLWLLRLLPPHPYQGRLFPWWRVLLSFIELSRLVPRIAGSTQRQLLPLSPPPSSAFRSLSSLSSPGLAVCVY